MFSVVKMFRIVIILVSNILFTLAFWEKSPIVKIEDGEILGKLSHSYTGKPLYEFHNIPYAAPPVGNLRFAEPVLPNKWNGVIDGTETTKICLSRYPDGDARGIIKDTRISEDCLYLTVMTPRLPDAANNQTDGLLPVFIFIYGGIFTFGNPTAFDYKYLVDEDILVVSFNFRSGSLGFLTTDDGVIPGNIGIKDQYMVLKWVNKNIDKFGGDPEKVTLGGHSSGAAMVSYHVLNQKTQGLFRAAIVQSGSALQPVSIIRNPREIAFKVGEMLSKDFTASQNTSEDLLKLLRSLPADVVCKAYYERSDLLTFPLYSPITPLWAPTVENPQYENAYVVGPMHENFENGISNRVPLLIGNTDEEKKETTNVLSLALMADLGYINVIDPSISVKKENLSLMIKELKDIYIKQQLFSANLTGMIKFLGDTTFGMPCKITAYLHSKFADVYSYEFGYLSPITDLNNWKWHENSKLKDIGKTAHAEELTLLFNFKVDENAVPSDMDLLIRRRMLRMWSNFVKYTNPTPFDDPLLENIRWPKVKQDSYEYMKIDEKLEIRKNPDRFQEWRDKIEKYFEAPRYSF